MHCISPPHALGLQLPSPPFSLDLTVTVPFVSVLQVHFLFPVLYSRKEVYVAPE